jgi:hypothetical protein
MKPDTICAFLVVSAVMGACGSDSTSPTAPTTRTSPVTETFASNLVVQGSVWRIVTAAQAGTLTATLTTTNQPSAVVGVAIGVRNGTSTGCLLNDSVSAAAGSAPQLSAQVDAGDYCVKVFDVGNLSTPMSFALTIVYP